MYIKKMPNKPMTPERLERLLNMFGYKRQYEFICLYTTHFPNIDMRLHEAQITFAFAQILVPEYKSWFEHAWNNWREEWDLKIDNPAWRPAILLLRKRLAEKIQ